MPIIKEEGRVNMKKYDEELKTKVIRLHLQEGRSQKSLEEEYNLGRGAIYYWLKSYSKECQTNPEKAAEKQDFDDYLRASLKTPFEKNTYARHLLCQPPS